MAPRTQSAQALVAAAAGEGCAACQHAHTTTEWWFTDDCRFCSARRLALGEAYRGSMNEGRLQARYRAALEAAGLTHDLVKAAAALFVKVRRAEFRASRKTARGVAINDTGSRIGEGHAFAFLSDQAIDEMNDMREAGVSLAEIGRRFRVSKGCVWKVTEGLRRGQWAAKWIFEGGR